VRERTGDGGKLGIASRQLERKEGTNKRTLVISETAQSDEYVTVPTIAYAYTTVATGGSITGPVEHAMDSQSAYRGDRNVLAQIQSQGRDQYQWYQQSSETELAG
jgi:hypothetical protein